jgi:ubiquinone biosynthesis monooxygenase Coq7
LLHSARPLVVYVPADTSEPSDQEASSHFIKFPLEGQRHFGFCDGAAASLWCSCNESFENSSRSTTKGRPDMDELITGFDRALRAIAGVANSTRGSPADEFAEGALSPTDRRHSAGLMRVNHVGEVCAQALYSVQAGFARDALARDQFESAASEEEDHLAWTAQRLRELGSGPSILNPLWYAGAWMAGFIAAKQGDARSLGFVVETERQVEEHLKVHLKRLPTTDFKSRAIVAQMQRDEAAHGAAAEALGSQPLGFIERLGMRMMAKVMTTTAYYL